MMEEIKREKGRRSTLNAHSDKVYSALNMG